MRWPLSARSERPTRRARRVSRPRLLESLETRVLLAGDILFVSEVPGAANDFHLMRYSQSGTRISSVQVPTAAPNDLSQAARGVAVDQNGNINVYNGTFSPVLSSYSPSTGTWQANNQTLAGWSTGNNVSYGGLTAYKNYIFASDMATAAPGGPSGIVRFDITGETAPTRFATDIAFAKVSIGQDGSLYGLGGIYPSQITVYDPDTMTQVGSVDLQFSANGPDLDVRGIAVDGKGEIFTATWDGYIGKYDSSGKLLAYLHPGGSLTDMTLDTDGQIVTSDRNGVVHLTNTSLSAITSFTTGQNNGFVTFDHFIDVTPPVAPTFSELAAPTITYGTATTTLAGKISDTSGFPTGSVTVTLNGLAAQASIDPATGTFSASFDTSKLGVSSSPYSIRYSYQGSSAARSALDTSKSLTVTQRVLTVTADDASKTYGDADPSFSASYSGFAPGEGPSDLTGVLGLTTAEPAGNAPVGTYGVTPSGLASPNYAITFAAGTLSVTPRALTVTASDASKTYGQPDPEFTANGSGFAPGEALGSLNGAPSFTTTEPSPLTAPVGTYAITLSGLTSPNYTITFAPGDLTVEQAVTAFAGLPSPSAPVGASSVSLSARLQSNSTLPEGQSVTVTILGSIGPLGTGSGVIQSDGTFTVVVSTPWLPLGAYTVLYSYAGDDNFTAASATGSLNIGTAYTVEPLYKTDKPHHGGSTIPIKLEVEDASGKNVSSQNLSITAVALVDANGKNYTPRGRGNANPGNAFRYADHGYLYNLDSTGLAPGRYTLLVSVGSDPALHAVTFVIG